MNKSRSRLRRSRIASGIATLALSAALAANLAQAAGPPRPAPITIWNTPGHATLTAPPDAAPYPPKDKDAREAWAEIAMLEDTRTTDVSRLLGYLSSSADSLVRWRVCRAFGRLQDSTAINGMLDVLNADPAMSVRREAAWALGQTGTHQAVIALSFVAREPGLDRQLRARAVEALGKLGGRQAVGAAAGRLTDPDPELSREAAIACWRLADSTAVGLLVEAMKGPDALTRAFCAYALEKTPMSEKTIAPLTKLLSDQEITVRAYAARSLGRQKSALALGPLVHAAQDKDENMRISVQRAFGALGDSAAVPQVLAGLADPSAAVRETAAQAAAALKTRDTLPALRKATNDSDPAVRLAAARAIVALAPDKAWADIRPLLADSQRWVRAGVIEALGLVPGDDARLTLKKVAAGLRPIGGPASFEERASAFSGIAAAKATYARDEIKAGIKDSNWLVVSTATDAAGASGDSTLTSDIVWVANHNPDPREPDVPLSAYGALETLGAGAAKGGAPADSVKAALATGLRSNDARLREAAFKAYSAVFGAAPATAAKAANPPPAWREGVLADYRAKLSDEDPTGTVGSVTGATMKTARGTIELVLDPREAPNTVRNFVTLAEKGYFDKLHWHRVVPYFVIQDGDPLGTGSGGPGYTFRCEYNGLRYDTGAMGMALSGKDTGGSQYFLTLSPQPHLDGRYTIFGHVVKGQDVVQAMRRGDLIEKVTIVRR